MLPMLARPNWYGHDQRAGGHHLACPDAAWHLAEQPSQGIEGAAENVGSPPGRDLWHRLGRARTGHRPVGEAHRLGWAPSVRQRVRRGGPRRRPPPRGSAPSRRSGTARPRVRRRPSRGRQRLCQRWHLRARSPENPRRSPARSSGRRDRRCRGHPRRASVHTGAHVFGRSSPSLPHSRWLVKPSFHPTGRQPAEIRSSSSFLPIS